MTTLAVPVRLGEEPALRPVPWRRMLWVTWRQHRFALGGMVAFLGAAAVVVWRLGVQLHRAYAAALACHPAGSAVCVGLADKFDGMGNFLSNGFMLQAVPPLVGAFVGATVLARELENGSFRFSWTQGFGRWRWALAKLVVLGAVVAAAVGALSLLTAWYFQPYFGAGNHARFLTTETPFAPGLFDVHGVAFAAWALVAFALGGLAGMLVRRVVPAIVTALAAYTGLAFAAGGLLRQHYLVPLVTDTLRVPGSSWIIQQWGTKDGKVLWTGNLPPLNLLRPNCPPPASPGMRVPKPSVNALLHCLPDNGHGFAVLTTYQPDSRFWPFQWIEAGWLVVLSALLIAGTVWLVRRRAV